MYNKCNKEEPRLEANRMNWLRELLQRILNSQLEIRSDNKTILSQIRDLKKTIVSNQTVNAVALRQLSNKVEMVLKIVQILEPPPPPKPAVSFTATIVSDDNLQGEDEMHAVKAKKATANIQVNDDGTFNIPLTFRDNDDAPLPAGTVPAGLTTSVVPSDATPGPSVCQVTTNDTTGVEAGAFDQAALKALVDAGSPLPTGINFTITANWTGLAAPLTVTTDNSLDIVANPNAVGGFSASVSN